MISQAEKQRTFYAVFLLQWGKIPQCLPSKVIIFVLIEFKLNKIPVNSTVSVLARLVWSHSIRITSMLFLSSFFHTNQGLQRTRPLYFLYVYKNASSFFFYKKKSSLQTLFIVTWLRSMSPNQNKRHDQQPLQK